jgi:hypothetical protein
MHGSKSVYQGHDDPTLAQSLQPLKGQPKLEEKHSPNPHNSLPLPSQTKKRNV